MNRLLSLQNPDFPGIDRRVGGNPPSQPKRLLQRARTRGEEGPQTFRGPDWDTKMTTNDDFFTLAFYDIRLISTSCHFSEAKNRRLFDDSRTTRGRLADDLRTTHGRLVADLRKTLRQLPAPCGLRRGFIIPWREYPPVPEGSWSYRSGQCRPAKLVVGRGWSKPPAGPGGRRRRLPTGGR